MSLHKLTAGDGYTYLTRQVAAHDATDRGYDNLGAYYSEKGESPGIWMGRSLATVPDFPIGERVSEAQMVALFGEGRHPNANEIERALRAAGASEKEIDRGSRLGSPYRIFEQANMFHRRCAGAFRDYNTAHGLGADMCGAAGKGRGSAPSWRGRCSLRPTACPLLMRVSCPGIWPGSRGRQPPRWPDTT